MTRTPAIVFKCKRDGSEEILVCSYNVLLPNHSSWWVFKYYEAKDRAKYSSWEYRKQLLKAQFADINADLLAVQETSPETFEQDFDFLLEDYEGISHRRSRIACAMFWRKGRFEALAVRQRDRSIITILRDQNQRIIAFVSCHLNAGQRPRRRFQQLFAISQQLKKEQSRYDIDLFVLAGDFNATGNHTAVHELLTKGSVEPNFREDLYPDVEISSNLKEQEIGVFHDVYASIGEYPTMEVLNARERILDWEKQALQPAYREALESIFEQFAENGLIRQEGVEAWSMRINKGLRGGEYREAAALVEEDALTLDAFIAIHKEEALKGKAWSLYADLQEFGISLPQCGSLSNRFVLDKIWYHSENYICTQARQPISIEAQERIDQGDYAPNRWHPSDHFPLLTLFKPKI
jgi:mRNA deadenylase 3'-5' endonuclease subunit Ccr4